ncbi:MAG: DHH family phosphoesterase [Gemmatimonadota bacterium]
MNELLAVPDHRRDPLEEVASILDGADDIALTTHVNADGDGAGSEAALAGWLLRRGKRVAIANPTTFPDSFRYLLPPDVEVPEPGASLDVRVRKADLLVVVDTGEPRRIGRVARLVREDAVVVLDHHPPGDTGIPGPGLRDPTACATGELVFDLFTLAGEQHWTDAMIQGVYAAIETDTGSFRFSNTTPRTHAIAAALIARGIDPEEVYHRLHATVSMERMEMLRLCLNGLERDPDLPIPSGGDRRSVTVTVDWRIDNCSDTAELNEAVLNLEISEARDAAAVTVMLPPEAVAALARFGAEECGP